MIFQFLVSFARKFLQHRLQEIAIKNIMYAVKTPYKHHGNVALNRSHIRRIHSPMQNIHKPTPIMLKPKFNLFGCSREVSGVKIFNPIPTMARTYCIFFNARRYLKACYPWYGSSDRLCDHYTCTGVETAKISKRLAAH